VASLNIILKIERSCFAAGEGASMAHRNVPGI
jgi:hypothetical protein